MDQPPGLIRLNKAHYPVTALGPGRRIGLWLQGCALACPGCISQDSWAFAEVRNDQTGPLVISPLGERRCHYPDNYYC